MRRFFLVIIVLLASNAGLLASSAAPGSLSIPGTAAGEQLRWALEQVNSGGNDLTEASLTERFTSQFLAELPPQQLASVFRDYLAPAAPMEIARFEGGVTERHANALLQTSGGLWRVTLSVALDSANQIEALFFEPVLLPAMPANPPRNWSELKQRANALAPQVSFIAAEIAGGQCEPLARVDVEESLAIASTFKLYVLGELARQVAAGTATWKEPLALSADLISQPNGEMRYQPVGAEFPLSHYVEQMISHSDNTATDHLIARLGRGNVENAFAAMGQLEPARNVPLMMTREWFAMKMRFSDDAIDAYKASDDATQQQILTGDAAPIASTLQEWEPWPAFRAIDSVEWFASAGDICRAMAWLQAAGNRPETAPVFDSLSLEPGMILDPAVWSYVGYKGGYETGVLSHTWLLQRTDGRWFVIAAIANDKQRDIDGFTMMQLMVSAAALLADA